MAGLLGAMPAASIGGEQFVGAAKKYGLPSDNVTLNKIIALVNQGMSPEEAAKEVSGKSVSLERNGQPIGGLLK